MIITPRFILRPLSISDVSGRYLSWLSEGSVRRFIKATNAKGGLGELREYVAQREGRDDVIFLGIFTPNGEHIGNVKYEPIDYKLGSAVMGILVGEVSWRGKGVAGEVINASAKWLKRRRGIKSIALGVDFENLPAILAYRKLGFVIEKTPLIPDSKVGVCTMVWHLHDS